MRRVFPTRVGMARRAAGVLRQPRRFPHPRGDGPPAPPERFERNSFSPPAWGWPVQLLLDTQRGHVFPTRVGMARPLEPLLIAGRRFPHPRGDGPERGTREREGKVFSPPAWGWPEYPPATLDQARVFPTRVGMARTAAAHCSGVMRFPHPRGDGPVARRSRLSSRQFSPPAWGWPGHGWCGSDLLQVFPTRVGMARVLRMLDRPAPCFPHPRGDGPVWKPRS